MEIKSLNSFITTVPALFSSIGSSKDVQSKITGEKSAGSALGGFVLLEDEETTTKIISRDSPVG
jgi:hypothetical protein